MPEGITLKLLKNQKLILKWFHLFYLETFVDAGINNEVYFQGEAPYMAQ